MYLAGLNEPLGYLLLNLIEEHTDSTVQVHLVVLAEDGDDTADLLDDVHQLQGVTNTTEREALTKARLG